MSEFRFPLVQALSGNDLPAGSILWVWHADKVPPHIGLSTDGWYYSLKVSGKDEHLPVVKVLETVHRKQIPTLLIELKATIRLDDVVRTFADFGHAIPGTSTCLSPVRTVLRLPDVQQLSELLEALTTNDQMGNVYGMYLPQGYEGLSDYSTIDIQLRLTKLQDASRKTHSTQEG